ncbi:terminase small subunit [Viridibacillus sp. NPDC096237]|uniref:terminase small subunit n=1 Tax=Viridibacillus sp. NPDC096237 TaxID=3390721 RepID=UPI003CFEDC9A
MARPRSPKRDEAFELWKNSNGEMKLKDIAEQLELSDSQIRKWKNRDEWDEQLNGNVTKSKGNVTKQKQPERKTKKEPPVKEDLPLNENGELTDKQWLFCMYYIKYFNATKAYQKAYACSYEVANKNAHALMVNHGVNSKIKEMKRQRAEDIMFDKNDVLQKYMDIAFADIGDYVEGTGWAVTVKPLEEVDTSIISEISNTENGVKIKLADKMKALDTLAKFTDLLDEGQLKQLREEKLKAEIAKVRSETKGSKESTLGTQHSNLRNLSTEELRALAKSRRN